MPYADRVHQRYAGWLRQQEQAGVTYTAVERWWLDNVTDVIAASAGISAEDLETAPFAERGGVDGAIRDLGGQHTVELLRTLNEELTA
ncbi:MAG: type I restriction endonuclease [Microbacterium sp. 14-71-5]|nr:MAG: type I restriction endonuclease [Microbacterium sp. 14-71-5]